ncbi:MAG: CopL family metal-binding regulatory protein [Dokdonella sp.]
MPVRSLWIRLLLSFAMILNGSVAVAGVMPGMAAAGDTSPTESAMAGAADCHDVDMQQGVADSNSASAEHASASEQTADRIDHTSPDCCKSGLCQCTCVQATATAPLLSPPLLTISTPALVAFANSGIVATHAPRLDRPPIA